MPTQAVKELVRVLSQFGPVSAEEGAQQLGITANNWRQRVKTARDQGYPIVVNYLASPPQYVLQHEDETRVQHVEVLKRKVFISRLREAPSISMAPIHWALTMPLSNHNTPQLGNTRITSDDWNEWLTEIRLAIQRLAEDFPGHHVSKDASQKPIHIWEQRAQEVMREWVEFKTFIDVILDSQLKLHKHWIRYRAFTSMGVFEECQQLSDRYNYDLPYDDSFPELEF